MTSIDNDIEFPFTSKFETQSIKVFCKYIIRNVVFTLVCAFFVGYRCINRYKTLIPSVILIAILDVYKRQVSI